MKKRLFLIAAGVTGLLASCSGPTSEWKSFSGDRRIEQRVDSVLSLMTLEEKIGQMTQFSCNWDVTGPIMTDDFEPYLKKGLVGSIFNGYTVEGVRKLQEMALKESRLKIPVLFGYDVVHGFRTIFPMPLAESCSWDMDLMERTARVAAVEASAEGINWTFAPMVDIARDPRWGRVMEGAGEDTYLGNLAAVARVKGFQGGSDWKSLGEINTVLACAKHFAAYGAAIAGRDYNTVDMSDRTLRETYLPPFEAARNAGVATFMTAFNDVDAVPATANAYLLKQILRNEWDFRGFVVTDYTAINELVAHGFAADLKEAGERSANAGNEMDMTGAVFIKYLAQSVQEGKVKEKDIDLAVRRILEMKFILGLFDDPYRYLDAEREKNSIMTPEHIALARDAARKSVVLLKNDKNLLPLDPNVSKTVALIGPMIKDKTSQNGEWAGKGNREQSVSLYEGLTTRYADSNVKFTYAQGCDLTTMSTEGFGAALSVARSADMVLVAMGEDFNWSGEAACRTDIRLPGVQQELLKELKKTGKPIVLVLMNGRPLDLSWENEQVESIVEAWYLGTMAGHGLTDVLSGDYNPSAKLTMTFPRNVGQIPIYYNHKSTGRPVDPADPMMDYRSSYLDVPITPLYPFGYGLSYTTFTLSNAALSAVQMSKGQTVEATVTVSNSGKVAGEQVVQLYVQDVAAQVTRPVKELKGFKKLMLQPGEQQKVSFTITEKELEYYGIDMKKRVDPGTFRIWLASDSADESNVLTLEYK